MSKHITKAKQLSALLEEFLQGGSIDPEREVEVEISDWEFTIRVKKGSVATTWGVIPMEGEWGKKIAEDKELEYDL